MAKPIALDPTVLQRLRCLDKNDRAAALTALCNLADGFGQPHAHAGLGVRKLGERLYECRVGLSLRLVFQDRSDVLFVAFAGTHDEVQRLLRRR